ncbi:Uncharacterised protein [Vibrio cholerae]|nr:Uncharacterised protein [Vibrio cholerae]
MIFRLGEHARHIHPNTASADNRDLLAYGCLFAN